MRRIYQVIIVGVATLSLCLFLIYKHEYDRLRSVIRVLNTFGEPKSENCDHNFNPEISYMTTSNAPFGEWRQFDDIHVFSAFWTADGVVRVHGMVPSDASTPEWTQCAVWNDISDSLKQYILGSLSIDREVIGARSWTTVTIACRVSQPIAKPPFGASFVEMGPAQEQILTPVIHVQSLVPSKTLDSVAICTSITSGPMVDESIVVQFVEYHRYVGVTRFVIYADGILLPVHQRIQKLASKYHDLQVEILPWNVPYQSGSGNGDQQLASSVVLKRDCLSRLATRSAYVALLEIHELLVARYHSHLLNFVKDEGVVAGSSFGGLHFDRKHFCLEFDDDPHQKSAANSLSDHYKSYAVALPPMFTKTRWIEMVDGSEDGTTNGTYLLKGSAVQTVSSEGAPVLHSKHAFLSVNQDFASVHSYVRCGALAKRHMSQSKYDDIIVKKIHDQLF